MASPQAVFTRGARALGQALRRHPWRAAGGALALCVAGALAVVFDGEVQKRFLLPRLQPHVTRVDIDSLRVTPWSLVVRGLEVEWRGLRAQVAKAEIGINPLALLTDTLDVHELRLEDARLDLVDFGVAEPSSTPFPGLLRTLEQGYGLALDDLDVDLRLQLPDDLSLNARLRGGRVRPHVSGGIDYEIDVDAGAGQVSARGRLTLDQLSHGRFRAIRTNDVLTVATEGLPAAERLATTLEITPAPGAGALRYRARRAHGEGPLPPEAVRIAVESLDARGQARANIEFNGLYHGADGSLRGRYTVDADDALVTPYVTTLPAFALSAQGVLGLQTMTGALDLTFDAATALSRFERVLGENPALPPRLNLHSAATLAVQGGTLALTRFEHRLAEAAPAHAPSPLAEVALAGALVVDLARPAAVLERERVLANLAVTGLPLPWLNGFSGAQRATAGRLDAAFELASDDAQRLVLLPLLPTRLHDVALAEGDSVLAEGLALELLPDARLSPGGLRVRLEELALGDGKQRLLGGKLRVELPLVATDAGTDVPATDPPRAAGAPEAGAAPAPLKLSFELDADIDAAMTLPPLAARREEWPLPAGLRLRARGGLEVLGARVSVTRLDARLARPGQAELARLATRQAFALPAAGEQFTNPRGELAMLRLRGIDFAWLSAFLDELALSGTLASADLLLTAPDATRLAVKATAPLRVAGLSVSADGEALVRELDVVAAPTVDYSPARLALDLDGLRVARRSDTLASGELDVELPLGDDGRGPLRGAGRLALDLRGLAAQPALRRALARRPPDLALDATLDFAAAHAAGTTTLQRLSARVAAGRRARLSLEAEPGLELRAELAPGERLARHVVGSVTLGIRDLSSAVIERFVPIEGVDFKEIDADLRLASDGLVLRADSAAPLRLERVRVSDAERALLRPFEFSTEAAFVVEERTLELDLSNLALAFDDGNGPALTGRLAAKLAPDRTVPLVRLSTSVSAVLPQWLSQPALMPGHGLRAGTLGADIEVKPDGTIEARALLDGLAAGKPLALSRIELPVTGRMAADGRGFSFTAPLVAQGRSGVSNAAVVASYAPKPGKKGLLELDVDSRLFYLNDLLATVEAVAPDRPPAPAMKSGGKKPDAAAAAEPIAVDLTPDSVAAWDVLPYGTNLDYVIDTLHYTDYLAFDDVRGRLTLRSRKLALTDVAARFHDSPLELDASLLFRPGQVEPYALDLLGTVKDFDLNKFSKELLPGEKPRIKGLFSVKVAASGEMPNLGQLRNETLFDVRMNSRKGVFRPLPPSSVLFVGTSDMLGFVGEGLSYVPTGGFGAGVLARLVNYISRFDYDLVDIHVRRAESRDIAIERFLVQSPTISMTAQGGVTHVQGADLLDSPLDLRASLDMAGRGAAILYSMGLLRDEQNDAGYWRGPEFRIWGTPAVTESNLAEILQQASDGTIKGGVTRPFAGIIGNVKYRWFGSRPAKAALDEDESSDVQPTVRRRDEED